MLQTKQSDVELFYGLSMANSQIMRRLECGTALDSVSASGTSRGLMVMQSRQRSVLAGVLPTRNECGGGCSSFENRLASPPDQRWSRIRSDRDTRAESCRSVARRKDVRAAGEEPF